MKINEIVSQYIDENASFVTMNRASSYFPTFIKQDNKTLYFSCLGTQRRPYTIIVKFDQKANITSSCSCPYDGYGICKHQVAALEEISSLSMGKDLDVDLLFSVQKVKQKPLILANNNGSLDLDRLREIQFTRNNYEYGEIKITSINRNKIESKFDSYRGNNKQTFKYDRNKNEISLDCTCYESQNCFHKYLFLENLKDKFGFDYFTDNYEEMVKEDILKDLDLWQKIDFNEIFELEITTEGIDYTEKVKNLITTPQLVFSPLENIEIKAIQQPSSKESEINFGLGLCFQFYENKLYRIFPFYGKLNKQKTEISSRLVEIEGPKIYDAIELLSQDEVNQLKLAINLSTSFKDLDHHENRYKAIAELLKSFQKFHQKFTKTVYAYDVKDNFAKKYLKSIQFLDKKIKPILEIEENGKFYHLKFKLKIDTKTYPLDSKQINFSVLGVFMGNELIKINDAETIIALLKLKEMPEMTILNEGIEHLKSQVIDPYSKIFDISFKGLTEKASKKEDFKPIRQVYLSDAEEGEYVVFQPIVKYAEKFVKPGSGEKIWLDEKNLTSLKRDYVFEDDFLLYIQNLHPEFYDKNDYFFIKTEQALESLWLIETIEQFKDKDIQVFGLKDLKKMKYNLHKPSFSTRLSSGTDWFDMKVDIEFGDQKVDLRKLQKAIIKNSNYVELSDGSLGIIPKQWIEKYQKYFKLGQIRKDHIEISNYNFNIIDELYEDLDNSPDFLKELNARRNRILNLTDLKSIKPSKNINAELRPYQKDGLNWMVFLHENKLGGCLADDMGLGKTLQSIAFLQYLKDLKASKNYGPSLVVSPTSLIFNWINEFDKFAPKLNILTFTGTQREELKDKFSEVDVVMTTYGSLIKDIEFHKTQSYNYVILDESQAIKNPSSQRFKAVRLLKAYNRLALTGTPIENNTFDLYSQFNFLNPGIFGSVKHFRTTFSDAIDKEQDEYTSALLAKMIKPFILRRTKSQVAKELPNKTESVIYCEMGKQQRKVYDNFKAYYREKLNEQIEKEGINRSQVYILQGLTKLRQICNSTALADKDKDYGNFSAKLDELSRHITEKVNNHKVLVFSQFVGMLDLVKKRLDDEKIIYEYLDGKTRDRESKVNRFQNDDDVRVFLISLKAGGTGLNLTKAEYVYLIDPWWNPAVENQAIDRCYRIGQDNHVFAYRMICKDTIEERIVELQDKKKSVASEVIRTDIDLSSRQAGKSFNKKDLVQFFGN